MNRFSKHLQKSFIPTTCAVIVCTILLAPEQAHAGYLDPGSGSTAVQWIIAGIASLGRIKRHFSDTISRIFGR